MVRIRPGFHKGVGACRETPQLGPLGLPAQLCIKQLYAALWSATPAKPFRGAFFAGSFLGWCSAPLLPPLGEVPRSGKGGAVGIFELLPFIERHPLSQPCRFRSAVKSASSPNGGAKVGLARICPRFHKAIGACRETPLRLAKSRLTAVARLHSACASLSQPLRAASSPIGEPRGLTRPSP